MKSYEKLTKAELVARLEAVDAGASAGAAEGRAGRGKGPGLVPTALADSEERLRAILETAVEGIITIDERGVVESINPAAERAFGYHKDEIIGRNISMLMPSPYREEHDGYLANYRRTGHAKIIGIGREVMARRKDGSTFPVDLSVSEVRLADRRLFAGFVRDISERKEVEKALAYYAAIVESSDDAIISKTLDGVITTWNKGAMAIFGYTREEAVGKNISMLIPPERLQEEQTIIERIRRGESTDHYETVRRCKDGSLIDISVTVSPIRERGGRIIGASKVARDITGRKRAEEALRQASEQRRLALEAANLGTWDYRFDSGEVWWDERCRDMWGIGEGKQIDYGAAIAGIHPDDRAGVEEAVRQALSGANDGAYHREFRTVWPDGSVHWITSHGRAYFEGQDGQRRPIRFIGTNRDISDRKRAEEQLASLAQSLAEKNRELETIVYAASHDLRSPLVNIQGFSRELSHACDKLRSRLLHEGGESSLLSPDLKALLTDDVPEAIRFIQAGVGKIDSLLSGFLRYSRLGRAALKIEALDMNAMMAEIAQAMEFQVKKTGATLRIEPLPDCQGDATQTNQVFSNLLDNAVKYLDPRRPGIISVSGRRVDGCAIYTVRDNGIGIAAEHQAKVFEIFHRLNPAEGEGEGLGLTIAQRILERQHGKIWVESKPGEGSAFFVSLPTTAPTKG